MRSQLPLIYSKHLSWDEKLDTLLGGLPDTMSQVKHNGKEMMTSMWKRLLTIDTYVEETPIKTSVHLIKPEDMLARSAEEDYGYRKVSGMIARSVEDFF